MSRTLRTLVVMASLYLCGAVLGQDKSTLASHEVAQRLPSTTLGVVVAPDFAALVDALGADAMRKAFPEPYTEMVEESTSMLGANALTAEGLEQLGVLAAGPAGLAWLDEESGALFLDLSDRALFEKTLEDVSGRLGLTWKTEAVAGGGTYHKMKGGGELGLVLWGDHALFLFTDEGGDHLDALAATEPGKSLASQADYTIAVEKIAPGGMLEGFLDLRESMMAPQRAYITAERARLDEQSAALQAARQKGSDDVRWREEDIRWAQRHVQRMEAELKVMETVMGTHATLSASAQISGSDLMMSMGVQLADDGLLSELLVNGSGPPLLYQVLGQAPIFAVHGQARPQAWLDLVGMLAEADGEDFSRLLKRVKSEIGVDVAKELLPKLSGEVGFAMTLDVEKILSSPDMDPDMFIGGALMVGINDADWFKTTLARIAGHKELAPFTQETSQGWTFTAPDWRVVFIAVVGDRLILTTDNALIRGVESGKGQSFLDTEKASMSDVVLTPDQAITTVQNWAVWGMMLMGKSSFYGEAKASAVGYPEPTDADYLKKKAELQAKLEAARLALDAMEEKHRQEDNTLMMRFAKRFGSMVTTCSITDSGMQCTVGEFFDGESMPKLSVALTRDLLEIDETDDRQREAINKAWDDIRRLEDELDALRRSAQP